jgi:hypothetical protein
MGYQSAHHDRDVTTGATGATAVAPKFSDTLTLSKPRGADSTHHRRGRSLHFPVVTSLSPWEQKRIKQS